MAEFAISLSNVGLAYRERLLAGKTTWSLKGVTLDIFKGETLGVVGRNGAGKSSLMKLLAGIIKPDVGTVVSHNSTVQLLSLQVGFMSELTGRENVILSSLLLGMRRKDIEEKMDEIIDFSELGEVIDHPLKTYSSGMRARLGFAVSCQADPDLLLIDEALGVGDKRFREKSRAVIEQRMLSQRSFVLVSHSEGMLKEYCGRCIWIDAGELRMVGDTDDVLNAYQAAN